MGLLTSVQFMGALEMGLIYGLVAVGVYLTFRVIDFPDLTVDGSFPLGAAIAATIIANGGSPVYATAWAFLGGALAGWVTAYLHIRWRILGLLAGILTMTGLYSINLRIMGRPNIALLDKVTLFSDIGFPMFLLFGIVAVITAGIILLLYTDFGLSIRATGVNTRVSKSLGIKTNRLTYFTLALSNGIVAVGGAFFAQYLGYADVTVGPGTIIIGLASVIIGEAVFRTKKIAYLVAGCLVGSVIYRIAVALALNAGDIGLKASDLKLLTALLITVTMILPKLNKRNAI